MCDRVVPWQGSVLAGHALALQLSKHSPAAAAEPAAGTDQAAGAKGKLASPKILVRNVVRTGKAPGQRVACGAGPCTGGVPAQTGYAAPRAEWILLGAWPPLIPAVSPCPAGPCHAAWRCGTRMALLFLVSSVASIGSRLKQAARSSCSSSLPLDRCGCWSSSSAECSWHTQEGLPLLLGT